MDFLQWINSARWGEVIDSFDKIAKILAVLIAGIWVYLNSIRGRTYVPRLKLELQAQIRTSNNTPYILVTMRAMNVGTSIAEVKNKSSGLYISGVTLENREDFEEFAETQEGVFALEGEEDVKLDKNGNPEDLPNLYIFKLDKKESEKLKHIEPSSELYEQKIVQCPIKKYDAYRIEMRVRVKNYKRDWRFFWLLRKNDDRVFRAITALSADTAISQDHDR